MSTVINKIPQKAHNSVLEVAKDGRCQITEASSNNNQTFRPSQNHPIRLKIRDLRSLALKDNFICPQTLEDGAVTTSHDVPYQRIVLRITNQLSQSRDVPDTQLVRNEDVKVHTPRTETLNASVDRQCINDAQLSTLVLNPGQNINNSETSSSIPSLNQSINEEKTIVTAEQPADLQTYLPVPKVSQRHKDCWYIYNNDLVFWDGKQLKCKHKKRRTYCVECAGGSVCIHNRIRNVCKECGGSQICQHQRVRSVCKDCGGSQICEHHRERNKCKECLGSSICEHHRVRIQCKECGGSQICRHNRHRSQCKDCKGSRVCQHNRLRSYCKDCVGSQICEHNRIKSYCKQCGGNQICPHQCVKSICKECGGSQICEHNRIRNRCKECGGSLICEHHRERRVCKECGGSQICEHNRIRTVCKDCGGGSICEHHKLRNRCLECNGSLICEHQFIRSQCRHCYTHPQNFCQICTNIRINKKSRTYPICYRCYCLTHPNEKLPSRFRMKQHYIYDYITVYCPEYDLVHDQIIAGGCSRRKPDILLDCLTHSIIIEIDENQHQSDGYHCEDKRLMQIFTDLGNRPLIVLRFNPDQYISSDKTKVNAIFSFDANNLVQIDSITDLHLRIRYLVARIKHHFQNIPEKELIVERLFYNEWDVSIQI